MAFHHSPKIVTNGLVLCLDAANRKSYSGTGTVWRDLAGSNNGTLTNGPTFNSANGGSIVFDGSNDYISCSLSNSLNTSSVSWLIWYKSQFSNLQQPLISKGSTTADSSFDLIVGPSTATLANELITIIGIENSNRVGYVTTNTNELFDNRWHHITMTASSIYKIYLDAIDKPLSVGLGSNNGNMTNSPSNIFTIGGFIRNNFLFTNTNGNIAQVLIYNRALTPAEVLQNYNATKGRFNL